MTKAVIIGRKVGMLQHFRPDGSVVGATVIATESNLVTRVATKERDGYTARTDRLRCRRREEDVEGRARAPGGPAAAQAPARGPRRRRDRLRPRTDDRRRELRGRRQSERDRHLERQGLPGSGAPPSLHARPEVARLRPPPPPGLGGRGHDAGSRAQRTAHGVAPGRRPRDREEPRGAARRWRALAAHPRPARSPARATGS